MDLDVQQPVQSESDKVYEDINEVQTPPLCMGSSLLFSSSCSILPILQECNWFAVIDLGDAYFHITIRQDNGKFLQFCLGQTTYKFKALPFGLSTAPWVFTKCMAPVAAHLLTLGILVFPYIDDWLLIAPSHSQALHDVNLTLSLSLSEYQRQGQHGQIHPNSLRKSHLHRRHS